MSIINELREKQSRDNRELLDRAAREIEGLETKLQKKDKLYKLAVAEREANMSGFLTALNGARADGAREFAKYLIDHSADGVVDISDLPNLVKKFNEERENK